MKRTDEVNIFTERLKGKLKMAAGSLTGDVDLKREAIFHQRLADQAAEANMLRQRAQRSAMRAFVLGHDSEREIDNQANAPGSAERAPFLERPEQSDPRVRDPLSVSPQPAAPKPGIAPPGNPKSGVSQPAATQIDVPSHMARIGHLRNASRLLDQDSDRSGDSSGGATSPKGDPSASDVDQELLLAKKVADALEYLATQP